MTPDRALRFRILSLLLPAATALAWIPSLLAQGPAGDLTITVRELSNGDVLFEARGTSPMLQDGSFSTTNFDEGANLPPHNNSSGGSFPISGRSGLRLTVPERSAGSLPEPGAEELPAPLGERQLPLDWVYFDLGGYWHLGSFSSGNLLAGDPVTGSGRATVPQSMLPFSDFVPGTFMTSRKGWGMGEEIYELTYRVIPYDLRLAASRPAPFRPTRIHRRGGTRRVVIRNVGSVPVKNLRAAISGPAARDFSVGAVLPRTLDAGESAKVAVSFSPTARGPRRCTLTFTGEDAIDAPAPEMTVTSQPEEDLVEPVPTPLPPRSISVELKLRATGLPVPKRKPRKPRKPNVPRFPVISPS